MDELYFHIICCTYTVPCSAVLLCCCLLIEWREKRVSTVGARGGAGGAGSELGTRTTTTHTDCTRSLPVDLIPFP